MNRSRISRPRARMMDRIRWAGLTGSIVGPRVCMPTETRSCGFWNQCSPFCDQLACGQSSHTWLMGLSSKIFWNRSIWRRRVARPMSTFGHMAGLVKVSEVRKQTQSCSATVSAYHNQRLIRSHNVQIKERERERERSCTYHLFLGCYVSRLSRSIALLAVLEEPRLGHKGECLYTIVRNPAAGRSL